MSSKRDGNHRRESKVTADAVQRSAITFLRCLEDPSDFLQRNMESQKPNFTPEEETLLESLWKGKRAMPKPWAWGRSSLDVAGAAVIGSMATGSVAMGAGVGAITLGTYYVDKGITDLNIHLWCDAVKKETYRLVNSPTELRLLMKAEETREQEAILNV